MDITCFTHYFLIERVTPQARDVILKFATKLVQFGYTRERGKTKLVPQRTFASSTQDREQFRFHINQLEEFISFLERNHISNNLINLKYSDIFTPTKMEIKLKDGWLPREQQVDAVNYIKADSKIKSKLVPMQTGKGKTAVAIFAIADLGYRTVAILKPGYLVKWVEDIRKMVECQDDDIMTVQGSDQLKGLLDLMDNGQLKSKFILISNRTYQNWVKQYELDRYSMKEFGYPCNPDELFQFLDAGIKLVDEVHQDFHLNYKIELYTNVPFSISLSATLINHDPFMERMYEIAFPKHSRFDAGELDKYIDSFAVDYSIDLSHKVETTERNSTMYSHHAFERSILKNFRLKKAYFKMIKNIIEDGFVQDYKPTEKLIVFCISIDMITELTEYLKEEYPQYSVSRYVAGDSYDELINSDIRVSSIQNAGTAIDIPNLKTVIQTINVNSAQSNVQSLGRLRKRDGVTRFYYTYSPQIVKHRLYHYDRKKMLLERCKSYKQISYKEQLK